LIRYPLLYKADTIVKIADTGKVSIWDKKVLFLKNNPGDQYSNNAAYTAAVKEFSPLKFEFEIESTKPGYYCLFQNIYPRWQLQVNGIEQKPDICNVSFMGFNLPAGSNQVVLKYKTDDIRISFYISIISFFVIFLLLTVNPARKSKSIRSFE
jgi:uncharacterized membrane protein YfhO